MSRGLGARWSVGGARLRLDLPAARRTRVCGLTWPRATGTCVPASQGRSGGKPRAGACEPLSAKRKHPCLLRVGVWIGARCATSDRRGARSAAWPWCAPGYVSVRQLFTTVSRESFAANWSLTEHMRRYGERAAVKAWLPEQDWQLSLPPDLFDGKRILCCPEDRMCAACPATQEQLCAECKLPLCRTCWSRMRQSTCPQVPQATPGTGIRWISCTKRRCGGLSVSRMDVRGKFLHEERSRALDGGGAASQRLPRGRAGQC